MFIEADYLFPPGADAKKLAHKLALGQTAGTWDAKWEKRGSQFKRHLAEVVSVRENPDGSALATLAFPRINVEGDIGTLLAMVFGKYSMAWPMKLVGLRLPQDYGIRPKFGIAGLREKTGVKDRPLLMAIFKPSLGLTAEDHGAIAAEAAAAGLDLIIDDEIMGDLETAPTFKRLQAVCAVSGRMLYAVNVTGPGGRIIEKARKLVSEGANALLFNPLCYGYAMLEALAADDRVNVPIFVHPAFSGALCIGPQTGVAYSVILGTLMAHAGADAVLYPTRHGNMGLPEGEEEKIRDALLSRGVFPVPSAGVKPETVPLLLKDYGNDMIINAGTAIMDHPEGVGAGVKGFFDAIVSC